MANVMDALLSGFTGPRRDSLWGHIYLTPALEAIGASAPFVKLHHIAQLGPAYVCYPGATHTRAAHSFGVYHLTRRILIHLAEKGADSYLSAEGAASMLCAALLHDVGHFPFAHSLKELPLAEHERLSAGVILSEPLTSLIGKTGADPAFVAAIIDAGPHLARQGEEDGAARRYGEELAFYRKILSGALDPDKLDYLNRDAHFCGVPYGAQDVDFIISMLHPHKTLGVEIDRRGIPSVESLLFSKYLMYRSVYWHHRVRCATSMVKKAVFAGLRDGVLAPEELYGLDDGGLFALLASRSHPAFSLARKVKQGRLFSLVEEFPYKSAAHGVIASLAGRSRMEEDIAGYLSQKRGVAVLPEQVVIDVPEEVVFDAGFSIKGARGDFWESSSCFTRQTIDSFIKALRVVRVYAED